MRSPTSGTRTNANCCETTRAGDRHCSEPRSENGCRRLGREGWEPMEKMDPETAPPTKTQEDKRPRDPGRWIRRAIEKYRKRKIAPPLHPDAAFFALADEVVNGGRTLLGYDRLYTLWQAVRNAADLSGTVAEIGSYQGGSAYFIAKTFIRFAGREVPFHIFDTFDGHPASAITANDAFHNAGQFGGNHYDKV